MERLLEVEKNISTGQLSQSVCEFFGSVWKFIWSICEFFGRVYGVWRSVIEIFESVWVKIFRAFQRNFWERLTEKFQSVWEKLVHVNEFLRTSFWPIYKQIIHCCLRIIQMQISNDTPIRKLRKLKLKISNFSDMVRFLCKPTSTLKS